MLKHVGHTVGRNFAKVDALAFVESDMELCAIELEGHIAVDFFLGRLFHLNDGFYRLRLWFGAFDCLRQFDFPLQFDSSSLQQITPDLLPAID